VVLNGVTIKGFHVLRECSGKVICLVEYCRTTVHVDMGNLEPLYICRYGKFRTTVHVDMGNLEPPYM